MGLNFTLLAIAGLAAIASATSTAPPAAITSASIGPCEAKRLSCQSTTTVNEAYCASIYEACLSTTYTTTQAPNTLASHFVALPAATDCPYAVCAAKRDACQSTTTVNEAYCASIYAGCLASFGISYDDNSPPPTTCAGSSYVASTPGTTITVSTTSTVSTPSGADTMPSCEAQRSACESTTTVNESYCASLYFACLSRSSTSSVASSTNMPTYRISAASYSAPPPISTGGAAKPMLGGAAVALGALAAAIL